MTNVEPAFGIAEDEAQSSRWHKQRVYFEK